MNSESDEEPEAVPKGAEAKSEDYSPPPEIAAIVRLTFLVLVCLFSLFLVEVILSRPSRLFSKAIEECFVGYWLGCYVAVTMMSALWAALGGGVYFYRLGIAALWSSGFFVLTLLINVFDPKSVAMARVAPFAILLALAWTLPQALLWALRLFIGIRIEIPSRVYQGKSNQFGIRHLLIFTSIVAVFLGAGRSALSIIDSERSPSLQGLLAIGVVIGNAAVMSSSLLAAALLERFATYAVLFILVLVGVVGYWEAPLLSMMTTGNLRSMQSFFVWQNASLAAWMMIFAFTLRAYGFRILR